MPPADVYRIVYKIYADTSELKKVEKEIERLERELSRKRGRFGEKEKRDMVARLNSLRMEAAEIYSRIGKEAAIAQARGYNREWVRRVAGAKMPIQAYSPIMASATNKELLKESIATTRAYISQALVPLRQEMSLLNRLLVISAYRFREFEYGMFSVMFGGWMLQWTFQGMVESYLRYYYTVTQGNTKISRSLMGLNADWNFTKFVVGESLGKISEKLEPVLKSLMDFAQENSDLVAGFIAITLAIGSVALWLGIAYMAGKILWGALYAVLSVVQGIALANPVLTLIALTILGIGVLLKETFGTNLKGTLKMAWNSLVSFAVAFLAVIATIVGKFVSFMYLPLQKMLEGAIAVAEFVGMDTSRLVSALDKLKTLRETVGGGVGQWYRAGMKLAKPFMFEMNKSDFSTEEDYNKFVNRYGGLVPGDTSNTPGGDVFNIQIIAPPDSNLPEVVARALTMTIMANSKRTY